MYVMDSKDGSERESPPHLEQENHQDQKDRDRQSEFETFSPYSEAVSHNRILVAKADKTLQPQGIGMMRSPIAASNNSILA